jgi:hypothetical protein
MNVGINFCENLFGKVSPDIRAKLQAVIDNPTPQTWDDTFCLIIGGSFKTLWQSVLEVDPDYLRSATPFKLGEAVDVNKKWSRVPSSAVLVKAINQAAFNKKVQFN